MGIGNVLKLVRTEEPDTRELLELPATATPTTAQLFSDAVEAKNRLKQHRKKEQLLAEQYERCQDNYAAAIIEDLRSVDMSYNELAKRARRTEDLRQFKPEQDLED